jgi:hypothetical protein
MPFGHGRAESPELVGIPGLFRALDRRLEGPAGDAETVTY